MCSRHSELNGAGADPASDYHDERDSFCDRCLRTVGRLTPQTMSKTTEWLCDSCLRKDAERYERMVAS